MSSISGGFSYDRAGMGLPQNDGPTSGWDLCSSPFDRSEPVFGSGADNNFTSSGSIGSMQAPANESLLWGVKKGCEVLRIGLKNIVEKYLGTPMPGGDFSGDLLKYGMGWLYHYHKALYNKDSDPGQTALVNVALDKVASVALQSGLAAMLSKNIGGGVLLALSTVSEIANKKAQKMETDGCSFNPKSSDPVEKDLAENWAEAYAFVKMLGLLDSAKKGIQKIVNDSLKGISSVIIGEQETKEEESSSKSSSTVGQEDQQKSTSQTSSSSIRSQAASSSNLTMFPNQGEIVSQLENELADLFPPYLDQGKFKKEIEASGKTKQAPPPPAARVEYDGPTTWDTSTWRDQGDRGVHDPL